MTNATININDNSFAACIGIDWADKEHAIALQQADSNEVEPSTLLQTPEAINDWAINLRKRFGGNSVAIAVELSRGPLIYALMKYSHLVIYPVPPAKLASYRKAFATSGAKNDPADAQLILDILIRHGDKLQQWKPDKAKTRELGMMTEQRRKFVDQQTSVNNQIISHLKAYFPQALEILGGKLTNKMAANFLIKWPDLKSLKRSKPETIRKFFYLHNVRRPETVEKRIDSISEMTPLTEDSAVINVSIMAVKSLAKMMRNLVGIVKEYDKKIKELFAEHGDDFTLFNCLPGAGEALAPRMLAGFGGDRKRYNAAKEIQTFSGIGPVTKRSGTQWVVHRRLACPNFLQQTFHEFAKHSINQSAWAKAYYQMQKDHGKGHNQAVRSLAFKWLRVIYAC